MSDAFATGNANEITDAVREIGSALSGELIGQMGPKDLSLNDALHILSEAGLQLVAIRTPQM